MTIEKQCEQYVKHIYDSMDASHDFAHIERVLQNAEAILQTEPTANTKIVRLAIYLHDVSDAKYSKDKENEIQLLQQLSISAQEKRWIQEIIQSVSYNGGNEVKATSLEAEIVRDADRLDAIGAIGIARAFTFGGAKNRPLYDINEVVREEMTVEQYRNKSTATVTHFYEKLLKIKDLMVTTKGKQMAQQRHEFMVAYLNQLKQERDGIL
jgi:uncharacterized protein